MVSMHLADKQTQLLLAGEFKTHSSTLPEGSKYVLLQSKKLYALLLLWFDCLAFACLVRFLDKYVEQSLQVF